MMQVEVVKIIFMSGALLTIVGFGFSFGMRWLQMRAEQQRALGASNRELGQKVERLERTVAEYDQRFENLEAIVVSQTWSVLQEPGLSEAGSQRRFIGAGRQEPHAPAAEDVNRQRAAELARRIG